MQTPFYAAAKQVKNHLRSAAACEKLFANSRPGVRHYSAENHIFVKICLTPYAFPLLSDGKRAYFCCHDIKDFKKNMP